MPRSLVPALALGVIAAALAACRTTPPPRQPSDDAPLEVRVAAVVASPVTDVTDAGGTVEARATAIVAARLLAPVRVVRVKAGDRVRAGQVLVELDGRDVQASARSAAAAAVQARAGAEAALAEQRAADAALALARATQARIATLHEKRSATTQELDQATAGLAAAEARVTSVAARAREASAGIDRAAAAGEAADATAGYLTVAAPFDGLVTETLVEAGNMATPGAPLVRLEDTRGFRLEVRADESRTAGLTVGRAVEVVLDGAGGTATTVQGTVAEMSRAVDAGARSAQVKIALPDAAGLRSGTFGRVRLPARSRQALTIPADAVVTQGQVTSVFVVADGVAHVRLVRLRGTEVQAGLTAGEQVVVAPPPGLTDGRKVTAGGRR